MRFINMYLIGIGAILAVGVGIMMAVSSGKPTGTAGTR